MWSSLTIIEWKCKSLQMQSSWNPFNCGLRWCALTDEPLDRYVLHHQHQLPPFAHFIIVQGRLLVTVNGKVERSTSPGIPSDSELLRLSMASFFIRAMHESSESVTTPFDMAVRFVAYLCLFFSLRNSERSIIGNVIRNAHLYSAHRRISRAPSRSFCGWVRNTGFNSATTRVLQVSRTSAEPPGCKNTTRDHRASWNVFIKMLGVKIVPRHNPFFTAFLQNDMFLRQNETTLDTNS